MSRSARRVAVVVVPPICAFATVLLVWQLIALHNPLVLPRLGAIASALVHAKEKYATDSGRTVVEAIAGLAFGLSGAFVVAVAMSQSRIVQRAVMPLVVVLNVTPLIALAPGFAISLGIGDAPRFAVTSLIVFFPFLMNLLAGLNAADREAVAVLETLAASRFEVLWRLRLPSSLPFLFAAARICFPLALVGAIVAELTVSGSAGGLGYLIEEALPLNQLGPLYAAVFCLAVIGSALFLIVVLTERWALGWYRATRGAQH
jgi:NitT/TauT family transport system permease protein